MGWSAHTASIVERTVVVSESRERRMMMIWFRMIITLTAAVRERRQVAVGERHLTGEHADR